ncbi:MAG TPA: tRNA nucleotidyltransferase, partial [Arachidicoccus soli]|nr:tRNA nucleotidyltransferase [Arachidicoccus soli]
MQIPCTDKELFIFKKVAAVAAEANTPAYVVGGFVRDKIIGRATKDIDIVCIGNGIDFANKIADKFKPKPHVTIFKTFGTAQIKLLDIEIEIVGARTESYRNDSRKPEVSPGTLQEDQNRRDFTINALSVSLNKGDYGELIDPFKGLKDLQFKIIRTPLSPEETF